MMASADRRDTRSAPAAGLGRRLGRGLSRRCPLCGTGLFTGWLRMRPVCAGCGLRTDRGEPDAFIGGYTVNFVMAELVAAAVLGGLALATWPAVPWRTLTWGGAALMVAVPILFYPFSRTLWLVLDLTFRAPREQDFTVRPGAGSPGPDEGQVV